VKSAPFRIVPTFSPRIWGARSLAPIFPDKVDLPEKIGEAWLTDERCLIASGPFATRTLGEVWPEIPADWRGARCAAMKNFPLLVKFIFPTDKLSIQVHPDDAYARVHEVDAGGHGKTEMWHVVSADPGAQLLLGLKPGVTKQQFYSAIGAKSLEDLFQTHQVEEKDTFFVPPGTPHSIGGGMIVCEVQEYCDLTYRVYDYSRVDSKGKSRELHVEKALDVINFGGTQMTAVRTIQLGSKKMAISLLAACRYFATERWHLAERFTARPKTDAFNLLVVLSGRGMMQWENDKAHFRQGECWFMPASLQSYELIPEAECSLIRTYVPDLQALRGNLRGLGVGENKIADVVFG
jgi:mannose-6-phosphate isomerase